MRTTLNIDDDLLEAARSLAQARSVSIGRVISELVRKGFSSSGRDIAERNGFPIFDVGPDAHPITLEDVKKDENDWW